MSQPFIILFYPEMPEPKSLAYKLCKHLGYKLSNNPTQPFDVAFKYFDATFFSRDLLEAFEDIYDDVINSKSLDISKQTLGECFETVFGYPIAVDPLTYPEKYVRKSNTNGWRDGEISTECSLESELDSNGIIGKMSQHFRRRSPLWRFKRPTRYFLPKKSQTWWH